MINIKKIGLLNALDKGPVICAEGYLFEMERRGYLKANLFVPEVVLDNPQVVEQLHRDYVHAGSDVVLAFTYYVDREKLKVIGKEKLLEPMYYDALKIARKVSFETRTLFAGNIGQSNVWKPGDKEAERKTIAMFEEQAQWSKQGGVEFIIAETISFFGEACLALNAIKNVGLPAIVNLAIDVDGLLRDGYTPEDACKRLADLGADVVGLNCYRGPRTLLPVLKQVTEKVKSHVAALPVAYHTTENEPTFEVLSDGKGNTVFPTRLDPHVATRDEMAYFAQEAYKLGARFIGGCCGTAPYHVRSMAEALGRKVAASKYSPAELTKKQKQYFIPVATMHKKGSLDDKTAR
ncbi:MAG: homocysteine S-methyltransferase family protein [Desulfobacterales bacterium]|nr:MAG: homocysteine S-methyltransferase family protein [Desulfobacterales bacterium]UCD90856.1 MAG: homocysteine S-methyltransferase family protein [Desulfobacterales bacterium]